MIRLQLLLSLFHVSFLANSRSIESQRPNTEYTEEIFEILDPWENCFTHLIDYTGVLDYSVVSIPIAIDTAEGCDSITKCNTEDKSTINLNSVRLRNVKCLLFIILVDAAALDRIERNVEALPPFASSLQNHIFPQIIVILCPQGSFLSDPDRYTASLVSVAAYGVLASVPPVFILLHPEPQVCHIDEVEEMWKVEYGYFFCWYCEAGPNQFFDFDCPMNTTCKNVMISTYHNAIGNGKNVKWGYIETEDMDILEPFKKESYCPFPSRSSEDCRPELTDRTVVNYLFEPLNSSLLSYQVQYEVNYIKLEYFPTVDTSIRQIDPGNVYFHVTGFTSEYRFITADGVTSDKSSINVYIKPFDNSVWHGLFAASVILAIFWTLTGRPPGSSIMGEMIWNTIRIITVLQEGPVDIPLNASDVKDSLRIALLTLMLSAVVVSNAYKGLISCSQLLVMKNSTKWRNLEEIQNFSLYFAFESPACHVLSNSIRKFSTKRFCSFVSYAISDESLQEPCIIAAELRHFVSTDMINEVLVHEMNSSAVDFDYHWQPGRVGSSLDRYFTALENMQKGLQFFCIDNIDTVIKKNLIRKRTALVTSLPNFSSRWERFQNAMSSNRKLKFAHNFDVEDLTFRWPTGYFINDGLGAAHNELVHKRMRTVVSSGTYSLWTKWANLRSEGFRLGRDKGEQIGFHPISFRTSDIHLIFLVYISFLALCIFVFLLQQISNAVLKKLKRAYTLHKLRADIVADINLGFSGNSVGSYNGILETLTSLNLSGAHHWAIKRKYSFIQRQEEKILSESASLKTILNGPVTEKNAIESLKSSIRSTSAKQMINDIHN